VGASRHVVIYGNISRLAADERGHDHRCDRSEHRDDAQQRPVREGDDVEREISQLIEKLAPAQLAICGCGPLTAAKILAETASIERFKSPAAYARHNGTAPLPVWPSNRARHRLSRTGNRQHNAAIHRIALTQAHRHPPAKAIIARPRANRNGGLEALRVLKHRLTDVVYRALRADLTATLAEAA
jgi:transposase